MVPVADNDLPATSMRNHLGGRGSELSKERKE